MEQNETLENDDVLEFDYTGTDQAGNLATMAETLSQDEAAAAMEAIESVRRKHADDAVRDFRAWFDTALLPILKGFAEPGRCQTDYPAGSLSRYYSGLYRAVRV